MIVISVRLGLIEIHVMNANELAAFLGEGGGGTIVIT